ncbi:hypothetical protein BDP55DRAFT_730084 [Colletotrichum godetiae]|uniref:NAD(P)-binding domain-containing protein n=1 Tax=Colletotrichum godetiae TaxID=1209918 RepID=A0AAJ0AHE3_9PEZI|nr:uncharacterized protein BDP55DRAFT_730084 [Colletotrichum godetiae]KAK1673935.1 hypothetical protein BDP55DRAFT_730084 [Colletotrichum godetiae]
MTSRKLRVAVIGPRGQAGSCVIDELLTRGHAIVGVSRNPPKQWKHLTGDGMYSSTSVDIFTEQKKLIDIFSSDFDAIVCAFGPSLTNLARVYEDGVEAHGRIKTALLASTYEGPFIIVGGAGYIHVANRLQLTDQKDFAYSWWWTWPDEHLDYMTERGPDHRSRFISVIAVLMEWSRAHSDRDSSENDHVLCVRTGEYKLFIDTPEDPAVEAAENGIYNQDMAVAIVDEVENNKLAFKHWSWTGPIGLRRW